MAREIAAAVGAALPAKSTRGRPRQLHVWLDNEDLRMLSVLARHFRESHSVVVRRLIRVAAGRIETNAGAGATKPPSRPAEQ
jgi:hypothetical protein